MMAETRAPLRKLIRIDSVCERLGGIAPRTIQLWVRDGLFPKPIRLGRRVIVWDESEVQKWVDGSRDAA